MEENLEPLQQQVEEMNKLRTDLIALKKLFRVELSEMSESQGQLEK